MYKAARVLKLILETAIVKFFDGNLCFWLYCICQFWCRFSNYIFKFYISATNL